MTPTIQKRLFLVGCPRSGTTLLQSMLATHSKIASFPESHFLVVTERTRRGRWMRKMGLVSPEMRQRLRQFLTDIGHTELMPHHIYRLKHFTRAFVSILDQLTLKQGKSIWLEKTPLHLYYIEHFEHLVPDARFIHLIRNGADVVASLYEVTNQHPEQWGEAYTIDRCINMWNHATFLSRQHCTKPHHLSVSYEKLVADPSLTLAHICELIGIRLESDMVDHYSKSAKKLILADEAWKSNTYQPINRERPTKFQQIFTPAEQAEIIEKLGVSGLVG